MATVTERIGQIGNAGRYIKMSDFEQVAFTDDVTLNASENISGPLMGTAVEYLTRLLVSGQSVGKVFSDVTLRGALIAEYLYRKSNGKCGVKDASKILIKLLEGVKDFKDDNAIANVCRAVTFDAYYRNPISAMESSSYEAVNPDSKTIQNIRTLTRRSVSFFEKYGPVTSCGFTFESSGYTETVDKGDGDFLTADGLWDMKVYRSRLLSKHALQVLMYWIMGQHSGQEIFKNIKKIGIYNPRMNVAYILEVSKIRPEIIRAVEDDVICY